MKYIFVPRASDSLNHYPLLPHLTVYEREKMPSPTGLVDEHGNSIYRVPEQIKMGFE